MGYDLHITRADDWARNRGRKITRKEWLVVVESDPELLQQPEQGPHFVEWRGGSGNEWLDWDAGNIYAKNPSKALVAKMCAIAGELSARVQGDDGEFYPETAETVRPQRDVAWFLRTCSLLLIATSAALLSLMVRHPEWLDVPGNTLPSGVAPVFIAAFAVHVPALIVTGILAAQFWKRERRVHRTAATALVVGLIPVLLLFVGR